MMGKNNDVSEFAKLCKGIVGTLLSSSSDIVSITKLETVGLCVLT